MKEIWSNVNYYLKDIQPEDCLSGLSVATKIDPLRELARLSIWCKTLEMKYSLAFSAENEHRLVLKLKDDNREMPGEIEHGCKRNDNREITRIACHCETNPKWVQLKFTKLDNKNNNAGKKYIDCNCERPRENHGGGEFWPRNGSFSLWNEEIHVYLVLFSKRYILYRKNINVQKIKLWPLYIRIRISLVRFQQNQYL